MRLDNVRSRFSCLALPLGGGRQTGEGAEKVLDRADRGQETILVPTAVAIESIYIARKKGYDIEMSQIIDDLRQSSNYQIRPMDGKLLADFARDDREFSIHDRVIVLTAEQDGARILTRDDDMERLSNVETVWK